MFLLSVDLFVGIRQVYSRKFVMKKLMEILSRFFHSKLFGKIRNVFSGLIMLVRMVQVLR